MLLVPSGTPTPYLDTTQSDLSTWGGYLFDVSQNSGLWLDGGDDTFDGGSVGYGLKVTVGGSSAFIAVPASNKFGYYTDSSVNVGANTFTVRQGWINRGIYLFDIRPNQAVTFDVSMVVDYGYDATINSGAVTKQFVKNGTTYELKTFWAGDNNSAMNSGSVAATQATVTIAPYQAAFNLPAANPAAVANGPATGDRTYSCSGLTTGVGIYVQWGQVTVDTVQSNIISNMVEVADLTTDPKASGWVFPWPKARLAPPTPVRQGKSGTLKARKVSPAVQHVAIYPINGKVAGHTKINGILASCEARIHLKRTGQLVGKKLSAANGYYEFTALNPMEEYYVVAMDTARGYNASVQDMIVPEVT